MLLDSRPHYFARERNNIKTLSKKTRKPAQENDQELEEILSNINLQTDSLKKLIREIKKKHDQENKNIKKSDR